MWLLLLGVKNPQATKKEIWICGNSLILTSKRRAKVYHRGLQLGVPASSAYVYWHGIQEMMWDELVPLLHEMYQVRSCPCIIIIHLGENDLLPDNCTSLILKIKNDLGILNRAFADTTLVWSSLLPRRFWKEDQAPEVMENALKFVNSKMEKYCSDIGAYSLSHELITSDQSRLFLPDSNDLSDEGTDIFLADLAKISKFLLDIKGWSYQSTSTWWVDFWRHFCDILYTRTFGVGGKEVLRIGARRCWKVGFVIALIPDCILEQIMVGYYISFW